MNPHIVNVIYLFSLFHNDTLVLEKKLLLKINVSHFQYILLSNMVNYCVY